MEILYLVLAIITSASVNIFSSLFTSKNGEAKRVGLVFNFILSIMPLIGWGIFYAIEGGFEPLVLLYSLGFGLSFMGVFIFLHFALKCGPLSLTTLLLELSLVFTAIWGIIFWGTPLTVFTIVGLCLIALSLVFCIIKKDEKKINFKWFLFALGSCACNAAASIIMKTEQVQFNNLYGGQMMFFAFVFIVIGIGIFILSLRKTIQVPNLKNTWIFAFLAGFVDLLLNIFVILLAKTTLSTAIIYPGIAIGTIVLNIIYSLIFNKEKLSILQIIGIVIGVAAIVLLSL